MVRKQKPERKRRITDEPMLVQPELLGTELASTLRRGIAFLADLFLWLLAAVPIMTSIAVLVLYFAHPDVYSALTDRLKAPADDQASEVVLKKEIVRLFAKRKPETVSPLFQQALASTDASEFDKLTRDYRVIMDLTFDGRQESQIDYPSKQIRVRWDLFFGDFILTFNLGILFLSYFTLFTWLLRGRTPGKLLLGLKVVRLDGRPIGLWDAFGRAGGYSASLSTFGLGFLEALWHPNRQTIHDRISSTVVILHPRKKPPKA